MMFVSMFHKHNPEMYGLYGNPMYSDSDADFLFLFSCLIFYENNLLTV